MTGDIPDTSPSFSTVKNLFNHLDRKDELMFDIKLEPTFDLKLISEIQAKLSLLS
ncbi:hypothetical protein [Pseudolactococcus chungangensis]|jgi:hypothetical protein|uniref:hypothetical protein n=1 Tax=Pseudolactococcus chungangensis TaxID=451457 RepID=UPI0028CFFD12|nr:hypothetical protein [Lactococcus chungangensis]